MKGRWVALPIHSVGKWETTSTGLGRMEMGITRSSAGPLVSACQRTRVRRTGRKRSVRYCQRGILVRIVNQPPIRERRLVKRVLNASLLLGGQDRDLHPAVERLV